MNFNTFAATAAALLLAACAGAAAPEMPPAASDRPALNSPAGIAQQLVAERTGARAEDVEIVSTLAMDFSDSSLGCPKPGMSYLQVITPGYQVLASYAGKTYDVRIAGQRALICDKTVERGTGRPKP